MTGRQVDAPELLVAEVAAHHGERLTGTEEAGTSCTARQGKAGIVTDLPTSERQRG